MKLRFSSLDVNVRIRPTPLPTEPVLLLTAAGLQVIVRELQHSLVDSRLSNIYDLSTRILLFKFAKPDDKKFLLVDAGLRCHLTDFARTTAAMPSAFVARLRKFLKTRRVTAIVQVGTDRILEFRFSDGRYRLFLEFFAVRPPSPSHGYFVADSCWFPRAEMSSLPTPSSKS